MNVAIYSIAGIILGATLQYLFTRVLEDRRHKRDLRTQAYTDYFRGISELRHLLVQAQASKDRERLARVSDAKARICLYGSKRVLARLAAFERLGAVIETEEQKQAFIAVVEAMRDTAGVSGVDLESVILGARR